MKVAENVYAERLTDGRLEMTFHQSGLNTLDLCLERGRLIKDLPRVEFDGAACGTAMHAGFEAALKYRQVNHEPLPLGLALDRALDAFATIEAQPSFEWKNYRPKTAEAFIVGGVALWYETLYDQLEPLHMEKKFGSLLFHEDEHFVFKVAGTIDYIDANLGLVDWKTAGRQYIPWEKQRWNVQSTVYTWAAVEQGVLPYNVEGIPFTFIVFVSGKEVTMQRITVTRDEGDWTWLKRKMLGIAQLVEADVPSWPVSDDHALCSDRWCPAWYDCKGAAVTPAHWRQRYEHGPFKSDGTLLSWPKAS